MLFVNSISHGLTHLRHLLTGRHVVFVAFRTWVKKGVRKKYDAEMAGARKKNYWCKLFLVLGTVSRESWEKSLGVFRGSVSCLCKKRKKYVKCVETVECILTKEKGL